MIALFSCTEDEIVKKGTPGDGHTLRIELTADANRVVSPLSKASADDPQEKVTDLNILIYDENGELVENESQYISNGEKALLDLSEVSTNDKKASTHFTLTDIEPGDKVVYVVANAGQLIKKDNDIKTEEGLKNKKFTMDGVRPQFVMFAEGKPFNVENSPSITSSLKRIYAMVTVSMVFKDLNTDIQIIPKSVQLKHIPTTGQLKNNNMIQNENECLIDGEKIEKGSNERFLLEKHSFATPLFLYENRQPEGFYNQDERSKTPKGFGEAITMPDIIKSDRKCSYIEIQARYIKNKNESGAGSGTITYRFFLGENATDNFDIQRNCHYKVTLTLTGDGGKDEATWRVEKDLRQEMSIQDIYIGYRQGAKSTIQATGDFDGASVTSDNKEISVSIDGNGKVTVISNETNAHDYNSRTFTYKYNVNGIVKTAKVIQVPRLVDPIAIYKKASNKSSTTIKVKAYSPTSRAYDPLQSVGPWCAIIKSSSTNSSPSSSSWFKIAPEGKLDSGDAKYEVSDTIYGEGPVVFDYQPLSANTNLDRLSGKTLDTEENDGARYGVILVKYHNKMCEHEIFLRQGYQPTTFNGTTWSMFNCTGLDGSGKPGITDYPTETGWLFKGGSNIGMHPYDPGYEELPKTLECSDGQWRKFADIPWKSDAWVQNAGSDAAKQGPCPAGYKLASAPKINNLFTNTVVYTGFVYDDDYPAGGNDTNLPYGYHIGANNNMEITQGTGNHCNPAKGSLFVSEGADKANIFFTMGKGILTQHRDENLIDEIGVGHRGVDNNDHDKGGYLKYYEFLNWTSGGLVEDTYGAFYWGGTRFSASGGSTSDRFSRVCISYDILTQNPYYVDRLTVSGNTGIDAYWHGNFVRCVRDGGGSSTPSQEFKCSFKTGNGKINEGTLYASVNGNTLLGTLTVKNGTLYSVDFDLSSVSKIYIYSPYRYNGKWYSYGTQVSVSDLYQNKTISLNTGWGDKNWWH